jgi:hypothetical protein
LFEFEDGSTAVHNLVGATSKACRTVHITGTKGEIQGILEDGVFVIRHPDVKGQIYTEQCVEINVTSDMHGGGDHRLVEDFLSVVKGDSSSRFSTSLENSIIGHLAGFSADASMLSGQSTQMDWNKMMVKKG